MPSAKGRASFAEEGGYYDEKDVSYTCTIGKGNRTKGTHLTSPFFWDRAKNAKIRDLLLGPHVFLQQYEDLAALYPTKHHQLSGLDVEWRATQLDDALRRLIERRYFFNGRYGYPQAAEATEEEVREDESRAILTSWEEERDLWLLLKRLESLPGGRRSAAERLYRNLLDMDALAELARTLVKSPDVLITRPAAFVLGEHLVEWVRRVVLDAVAIEEESRDSSTPRDRYVQLDSLRAALRLNKCGVDIVEHVKEQRTLDLEALRTRVLEAIAKVKNRVLGRFGRAYRQEKQKELPSFYVYSDSEEERAAWNQYKKDRLGRPSKRKKWKKSRDDEDVAGDESPPEPDAVESLPTITDHYDEERKRELDKLLGAMISEDDGSSVELLHSHDLDFIDDDDDVA